MPQINRLGSLKTRIHVSLVSYSCPNTCGDGAHKATVYNKDDTFEPTNDTLMECNGPVLAAGLMTETCCDL